MFYAIHEFSFDQYHDHSDRIYRVYRWTEAMQGRPARGDAHLPLPMGQRLKDEFPDIEHFVRWHTYWGERLIKVQNDVSRSEVSFADQEIFEVFSFPIKYGNQK